MVLTTRNNDSTKLYAWDFLIKRFARIWPLYGAVSVVVFLGVFGPGHPTHGTTFSSFLDSLLLILIDPKAALTFGMPVSVAWTLCFEFYFYLVFGASMLFGRWRWLAMAVWFGSTLGGISYSLYLTHLIAFFLTSRAVALIGLPDPAKVAIGHFILAPAVAIVMAALVYAAVEPPLSNWTRSTLLGIRPSKRNGRLVTGATQAS